MTLLDMIRYNRQAREARPPKRPAKPYLCPAWPVVCSQRCFLRHECAARPEQVMAMIARLDVQTEHAMVEYAQRLR